MHENFSVPDDARPICYVTLNYKVDVDALQQFDAICNAGDMPINYTVDEQHVSFWTWKVITSNDGHALEMFVMGWLNFVIGEQHYSVGHH